MTNNRFITILQLNDNCKDENHPHHLSVPLASPQNPELFRHKSQIVSISGLSPKERNRYRVMLGTQIIADQLSIDEALNVAKGGEA